jgi:hypothetical protein
MQGNPCTGTVPAQGDQFEALWVAKELGPRTYDQVVDNLGALDVTLTQDDFDRIDALVPPCSVALRYDDLARGVDLRPHLPRVP